MTDSLFTALYVDQAPFQWVQFTPFGLVRGALSPAAHGRRFYS